MNRRLVFILIIALLVVTMFISGCAGTSRIGNFFQNGEYLKHSKIIDFFIFFTLFFSLTYLGFTKWFGEGFGKAGGGKGAIVGLSLSLSLALSFAITTQTKFSITTMFPLAKLILMLAVALLLYGLLNNMLKVEGPLGKIILFMFCLIFAYIMFSIFTYFVCMSEGNLSDPACRGGAFTWLGRTGERYIWGSWFKSPLFGGGSSGGSGVSGGSGGGSSGSGGSSGKSSGGSTAGGTDTGTKTTPNIDKSVDKQSNESTVWTVTKYGVPLLLLLLFGLYMYKRRKSKNNLEYLNRVIEDYKNNLTHLWQRRAEIIREARRRLAGNPAAVNQLDADYQALCALLQNLEYRDEDYRGVHKDVDFAKRWGTGGTRLSRVARFFDAFNLYKYISFPRKIREIATRYVDSNITRDLNAWFDNPIPGVAPPRRYFEPELTPNERESLQQIVIQEKEEEYKLMRTYDVYRQAFERSLEVIKDYDTILDTMENMSPIIRSDGTVTIVFDSRRYSDFDSSYTPKIIFYGKAPQGAAVETLEIDDIPSNMSAKGTPMIQDAEKPYMWRLNLKLPRPVTHNRYLYKIEYKKGSHPDLYFREGDVLNNLKDPDKDYSMFIA